MFRLIFLAFYGESRTPEEARHHLHESPFSMTGPLMILGILSVIGGFVGIPVWMNLGPNRFFQFLEPSLSLARTTESHEFSHMTELGFAALSLLAAGIGIALAYRLYVVRPGAAGILAARLSGAYRILFRKYYVDELYDAVMVNPTVRGSTELLWKRVDVGLVDGAVNGVATMIQKLAAVLKNFQNGLIRSYATWILLGTAAILFYISFLRS